MTSNHPARIIVNNSGILGQRIPDAAVRMFLWESLAIEIRGFLMGIEDSDEFEQAFVYECIEAKLIEPMYDGDEHGNGST